MLKIGDKVRYKKEFLTCKPYSQPNDTIFTIVGIDAQGFDRAVFKYECGWTWSVSSYEVYVMEMK